MLIKMFQHIGAFMMRKNYQVKRILSLSLNFQEYHLRLLNIEKLV